MDTSYMGTDASAGTQMTLEPSEKAFSYADDKSSDPTLDAAVSRMKSKGRKASMSRFATVPLSTRGLHMLVQLGGISGTYWICRLAEGGVSALVTASNAAST